MTEIKELIPQGRDRAVTVKELSDRTGIPEREVKRLVQELRDSGEFILSSGKGYFYPTNDEAGCEDARRFIFMMETQAKSRYVRIRSAKRWLKEYRQVGL